MPLRLPASAKINWFLRILGRRPDGYHELVTLLQTVDWHDDVELSPRSDGCLVLSVEGADVPRGEDNLALRAGRVLQEAVDGPGADIVLRKRLPPGGGLGGGSSDAAAVLRGLNALWGAGLDREQLAGVGRQLGSDVPFFLWGGTALGTGRGEQIETVEDVWAGMTLLLVLPPFPLATATVYSALESRPAPELTRSGEDTRIPTLLAAVRSGRWAELSNDLEIAAFGLRPELKELRDRLRSTGAVVLLCGSGSTLVAFGDDAVLAVAQDECARMNVEARQVRVLPRAAVEPI